MADARVAVRLLGLLLAFLAALSLHGIWRAAGRRSPWPRRYLGCAARIAGARVRVCGTPLTARVLLLANHQSPLDIPALASATGCAFVAKGELARAPAVGWLARLNATVFVSRGDRIGVAAQVERVRAALGDDRPIAIFPEGGTNDGVTLLPFKSSLLAALDPPPPGARVQPVWIDYGRATPDIAWPDGEPGVAHMRRVLGRPDGFDVTLHFLPPFAPADFPDRKAIAAEARRRIVEASA